MGPESVLRRRGIDRAVGQVSSLVELVEQQTGATERTVDPGASTEDSPRGVMLEELFALTAPAQRLTSPSCASTQAEEATTKGSRKTTFPARTTASSCSISERAFAQSPLRRWSVLAAQWATPMVNACCVDSAIRIASASY